MNPNAPPFQCGRQGHPGANPPATSPPDGLANSRHNPQNSDIPVDPQSSGNNPRGTDPVRSDYSGPGLTRVDSHRGSFMDSHPNKKRRRNQYDLAFAFPAAEDTLLTTFDEWVNRGRGRLTPQLTAPIFQPVNFYRVVYQPRQHEASLLETGQGQINWYATDPTRAVGQGLFWKVAADDRSIDAYANTMKTMAKAANTTFFNIRSEMEGWVLTKRHRVDLAKMEKESRARLAVEDKTARVETCAQCKQPGHKADICVVPNGNYGCIKPCPVCNSNKHLLDFCDSIRGKKADRDILVAVAGLILLGRANRPQIRSAKMTFADILVAGKKQGYLTIAESTVIPYPWSNKFAIEISQSKPGDAILQGKRHPSEFDYKKDTFADLPADPIFAGKTIAQIIAMNKNGELDFDRFVPIPQRPETPLSDKEVDEACLSALVQLGALQDDLSPRFRNTVITDAGAAFISLKTRNGPDIEMSDETAVRFPAAGSHAFEVLKNSLFRDVYCQDSEGTVTVWAEAFADNADGPRRNPDEHRAIFERVLKFFVDKDVEVDPNTTNYVDMMLVANEAQAREDEARVERELAASLGPNPTASNAAPWNGWGNRRILQAKTRRVDTPGFGHHNRNDR